MLYSYTHEGTRVSAWLHLRSQICLRQSCFDPTTEGLYDGWKMRCSLTRRFNLSTARTFPSLSPDPSCLGRSRRASADIRVLSWSLQFPRSHGQAVTLVLSRPSTLWWWSPDRNNPPLHYLATNCFSIFFFFLIALNSSSLQVRLHQSEAQQRNCDRARTQ